MFYACHLKELLYVKLHLRQKNTKVRICVIQMRMPLLLNNMKYMVEMIKKILESILKNTDYIFATLQIRTTKSRSEGQVVENIWALDQTQLSPYQASGRKLQIDIY